MKALQEVAVDTGPLVEFFSETPLGLRFEEKILKSDAIVYIGETTVSEVYYVLCRQLGIAEAKTKIKILLDSVEVIEGKESQIIAGEYKCKRALALSDCFTIATAKIMNIPALFKKEQELLDEIKKENFDVEVLFIEDL